MTDALPDQPQAPVARCPLQTCDADFPYPASGDLEELEPILREHTESHTPEEFMNTIGILQGALFSAHSHINDLESALRGANYIMQANGILPPPPGTQQPSPPSGLLLPESAVGGGKIITPGQTPKHGDIVPGRGKLVGKKITDPTVLRDLKKGGK